MNCDVRSRNTNESDRMLLLFAGLLLNLNLEKILLTKGLGGSVERSKCFLLVGKVP